MSWTAGLWHQVVMWQEDHVAPISWVKYSNCVCSVNILILLLLLLLLLSLAPQPSLGLSLFHKIRLNFLEASQQFSFLQGSVVSPTPNLHPRGPLALNSSMLNLHQGWRQKYTHNCSVMNKKRHEDYQHLYESRLKSSWTHITPNWNFVEVRWRSLFRSTSLGKWCTSYNAPPTS
jgi:hypothetical protein